MFEAWTVETGTGGFYRVYTPFWKAVRGRHSGGAGRGTHLASPHRISPWGPGAGPRTRRTGTLAADMGRGAEVVGRHPTLGEKAARTALASSCATRWPTTPKPATGWTRTAPRGCPKTCLGRDRGCSCWQAGMRAKEDEQGRGRNLLERTRSGASSPITSPGTRRASPPPTEREEWVRVPLERRTSAAPTDEGLGNGAATADGLRRCPAKREDVCQTAAGMPQTAPRMIVAS